jgi:hypothetical protein
MKQVVFATAVSLGLISCGGGSGSSDPVATPTDVNVSASANGAMATASFNSATALSIIDGDVSTTWISDPDSPLVIDFSAVNNVKKITIHKVSAVTSGGSNPDILVELSEDGSLYQTSDITMIIGGDLSCNSSTFSAELLECEMDEFAARYLRLTSQNGKSFEFEEVEVISNK